MNNPVEFPQPVDLDGFRQAVIATVNTAKAAIIVIVAFGIAYQVLRLGIQEYGRNKYRRK